MLNNRDKISYLLQILNGLIPLVIISVLTRMNGLAFMGEFFLLLSIVGATQLLVDYGFNLSGVRSFAAMLEAKATGDELWSLLASIVVAKSSIAVALIIGLVLYGFIAEVANSVYVAICVAVGIVLAVTNVSPAVFALRESYRLSLFTLMARAVLIIPLILVKVGIVEALAVTLAPMLMVNVYAYVIVARCVGAHAHEVALRIDTREQFSEGWSIFVNSVVASLIATAWPLILSHFLIRSEVGVYGIADKIVRGLMSLITPLPNFILASSLGPSLSGTIASVLNNKLYRLLVLAVLLAPVVFYFLPDRFLALIVGVDVIKYRMVLNIYAFGFVFYFIDLLLYTYLIMVRRERVYAPVVVVAFLLSMSGMYVYDFALFTPLISESLLVLMLALILVLLRVNAISRRA